MAHAEFDVRINGPLSQYVLRAIQVVVLDRQQQPRVQRPQLHPSWTAFLVLLSIFLCSLKQWQKTLSMAVA